MLRQGKRRKRQDGNKQQISVRRDQPFGFHLFLLIVSAR
jgi:hypothetical protein